MRLDMEAYCADGPIVNTGIYRRVGVCFLVYSGDIGGVFLCVTKGGKSNARGGAEIYSRH